MDKFNLDVSLVARLCGHSAPRTYRDHHLCFDEKNQSSVFWENVVASLKRAAIDGGPPPGVEPAAQHGKTHQVWTH